MTGPSPRSTPDSTVACAHPVLQARISASGDRSAASQSRWQASRGEWPIVVSNTPARQALAAYRKRWAMICLFGDAKTRGLNFEDTRLTQPRKLALLMALVV